MRYVVKHAGGGLWRVIDEETNLPINDALMSKDEAKATAEAANKAAAPLEEATPEVPATIAPLTFIVIPAGNSLYSVICETTGDFISTAPMLRSEAERIATAANASHSISDAASLPEWPRDPRKLLEVALQLFGLKASNVVLDSTGKPAMSYFPPDQEEHRDSLGALVPLPLSERGIFSFVAEWKQLISGPSGMLLGSFRDKLRLHTNVDPKHAELAKVSRRSVIPIHV